jgi:hypothetical protein
MCDQVSVVVHEAAHAVIGHLLGSRLTDITLEGRRSGSRIEWTGCANFLKESLGDSIVQIAVAGALADIKMLIIPESDRISEPPFASRLMHVRICPESVASITKALWDLGTTKRPNSALFADVKLDCDGSITPVRAFLQESDCDMARARERGAIGSLKDLEKIVSDTRDLLDAPQKWLAVLSLAQRLLEEKGTEFLRKRLCGTTAEHIIESAISSALPPYDEKS